MTSDQIELVKRSWLQLRTELPDMTRRCYGHLFERQPALRRMFVGSLDQQQAKLAETLDHIVAHIDDPAMIADQLQALGRRHTGYGVRAAHYGALEAALIDAMRDTLGEQFDPATEAAWRLAFNALAEAMRSADLDGDMFPA